VCGGACVGRARGSADGLRARSDDRLCRVPCRPAAFAKGASLRRLSRASPDTIPDFVSRAREGIRSTVMHPSTSARMSWKRRPKRFDRSPLRRPSGSTGQGSWLLATTMSLLGVCVAANQNPWQHKGRPAASCFGRRIPDTLSGQLSDSPIISIWPFLLLAPPATRRDLPPQSAH
jgi:hypothetical protein